MAVTVRSLPTLEAANTKAVLLFIATLFMPLLESVTAPVKLLLPPLVAKSIALAPALKLAVPGTVSAPVCVIAPFAVTVRLLPTLEAANTKAVLSLIETSFMPLLESVTAPVKLLPLPLVAKSIALAPALKLDVPATPIAPVCVIAPPALATRLPLRLTAPKLMPALSKSNVRLRKLVNPVKLGVAAAAFTFLIATSRMSDNPAGAVLLNTMALDPKSLACVFNKISEFAALTPKVVVPAFAVITPVCVILPPAVKVKSAPTLTVPNCKAELSTRLTLFAPVLARETVPVNVFPVFVKAMLPVVCAVKLFALIAVPLFWVTAPLISPAPNVKVPALAVILPRATVVPLAIVNAEDELFVVLILPSLNCMAPPPALMLIVPLPELMVDALACVTPTLFKEIALSVVLIF